MNNFVIPSHYHNSLQKRLFDVWLSSLGLIVLSPLFLMVAILIKLTSRGPIFFKQKRIGKDGKVFTLIKFRTMRLGAERQQWRYRCLNEADGPVFKIWNDPRFVGIGRILARTVLDELPQLINVIRGEMSLVGPRPFPISEAEKLTKSQQLRHLVKPGITSEAVVRYAHSMRFEKWMELDLKYIQNVSFQGDLAILSRTFLNICRWLTGPISQLLR